MTSQFSAVGSAQHELKNVENPEPVFISEYVLQFIPTVCGSAAAHNSARPAMPVHGRVMDGQKRDRLFFFEGSPLVLRWQAGGPGGGQSRLSRGCLFVGTAGQLYNHCTAHLGGKHRSATPAASASHRSRQWRERTPGREGVCTTMDDALHSQCGRAPQNKSKRQRPKLATHGLSPSSKVYDDAVARNMPSKLKLSEEIEVGYLWN